MAEPIIPWTKKYQLSEPYTVGKELRFIVKHSDARRVAWRNALGSHLLTPLVVMSSQTDFEMKLDFLLLAEFTAGIASELAAFL